MKDFVKGRLSSSFFTFAAEDYEEYLGSEEYNEVEPDFLAFILQSSDTFYSVQIVLQMVIALYVDVIIIDVSDADTTLITSILKYMENTGLYENLESYEDRLCFGKR